MGKSKEFNTDCNCTYTMLDGTNINISIAALLNLIKNIPTPPRIYRMDIKLFKSFLLPENSIIMSESVADALIEALKKNNGEE